MPVVVKVYRNPLNRSMKTRHSPVGKIFPLRREISAVPGYFFLIVYLLAFLMGTKYKSTFEIKCLDKQACICERGIKEGKN